MLNAVRHAVALGIALTLVSGAAAAQTTVTISEPVTRVDDARIQGGTFAGTVFHKEPLATKIHPSNPTYTRRSVLKFDTHNTVPAGATVQSATLTLTISKADAETRTLGIYRLSQTFDEAYASWSTRKSGLKWTTAGGDLAEKFAQTSVGASVGARVSFDVTKLVQGVVSGTYGSSRYTRVALVDLGSGSNTSYKEFHHSESSDPAVRPVLKVVYGGTAPAPAPAPSPTGATLKVLHWNIHRAWGTDDVYSLDRIASWIVKMNPNVVSLNEVERYTSYANEDQPARLQAMLKSKTGASWYLYYRTGTGSTNGHGNAILSRFPIASTAYCQLSSSRVAAQVAITVNGRLVNFFSTHLDSSSTSNTRRISEVKSLKACLAGESEQKVIAGDFNAKATTTEIGLMTETHLDAWAKADSMDVAYSYPGNTSWGATRNSRIDYVFVSKSASAVVIKKAEVIDTRDASGYMPSDHKPLVVTLDVK